MEKAGVIKGKATEIQSEWSNDKSCYGNDVSPSLSIREKVHEELPTLFPDVKDHWGEKFINILVGMGISSGVDGRRWQPDRSITRAEAAQLVAVTDKSKDNELKMKKVSISKNFYV